MNRAGLALVLMGLTAGVACAGAACSSSSSKSSGGGGTDSGTTTEAGGEGGAGGFAPTIACTDSITSVYADPGDVSAQAKGAILKCAHDQDITAAALLASAQATDGGTPPYSGKPFTSGAHVYRVLYRTERGDPNNTPGFSSALVLLPDTPRASVLPVVVASHGSRGQAAICAPSKMDPAASDVNPDFIHQVYPLVGFGYAVIAPDLAGYAGTFNGPNNPPSAYADTLDVGKSTLDGVAALRNVLPTASLSQQIAIVGHSQGGHTALSALAISGSYPVSGTIAAVAVYAPLWFSARGYGALLLEPAAYAFDESSGGVVSLWYHYTHTLLLDGPDSGFPIFNPATLPVLTNFVDNTCWSSSYPALEEAGASANAFFTTAYANGIDLAATPAGDGNCQGDPTCTTWIARMTADWPDLTGAAAKTPILLEYANNDQTITPDLMQCVLNRLSTDTANYTVCYDTAPVGHSGSVSDNSDYVADWIAQQTLGAPAPTETCGHLADNEAGVPQIIDVDSGAAIPCNQLVSTQ